VTAIAAEATRTEFAVTLPHILGHEGPKEGTDALTYANKHLGMGPFPNMNVLMVIDGKSHRCIGASHWTTHP
jgi:hypothetical protein